MSDNRRHTDVLELGWADLLLALAEDRFIRAEGHDELATQAKGRLVRFNVAVEATDLGPTIRTSKLVVRTLDYGASVALPTGLPGRTLTWEELDWVSWNPAQSASGRRFKVTVEGRSMFGPYDLWEGRIVERETGRVLEEHEDRAAAVAAVVRRISAA